MPALKRSERLEILAEIDILLKREAAGEDVDAELKACGRRLKFSSQSKSESKKKYFQYYDKASLHQAQANGITGQQFYRRVVQYKWSEWEAINIPAGMRRKEFYESGGKTNDNQTINTFK